MQRIIQLIMVSLIFVIHPAQAEQLAGEVTAVMGDALIVESAAGQHAAVQGLPLHVGDVLQTGAGGHIHIRMIDDALVSLRPNSKLKITSYTYQPGVIATTQIRFDLLQGTVRSVTGKGGQQAKDRFRMNTPVAAIGVRGTDFIAQTNAETTLVNVQSGAIVLAPLGEGCRANALGPCQTAAARVLGAGMQNMMLKFNRGTDEPKLVPLGEGLQVLPAPEQHPQTRPTAPVSENVQVDAAKQALDTHTTAQQAAAQQAAAQETAAQQAAAQEAAAQQAAAQEAAAQQAAAQEAAARQAAAQQAAAQEAAAQQAAAQQVAAQQAAARQAAAQQAAAQEAAARQAAVQIPIHYQMVWGHWGAASSGDDLGRAYLEAAQGREVTIGNDTAGLFRDKAGPMALPLSGRTEFNMREAQVTMLSSGIAGKVLNGSLGVSFDTQTFNTQLDIQHPALTNMVTLNANGALRSSDGMLFSLATLSNGTVVGGLSRDGAEAGYQFQLPTVAGTLAGTTLWAK